MIKLIIDQKIVDEQLIQGKKIYIQFSTLFNGMEVLKKFPDDFTEEQQGVFKQIYELAVYGSEVGRSIYKCSNSDKVISITGYKRTEPTELGVVDFNESQLIRLNFIRYGIENKIKTIEANWGAGFTPDHLNALEEIGISVIGTINQFEVIKFDGDISIEVSKGDTDSFIDLGGFINGKLIIQK